MKILVLNGPNLDRLGSRQPEVYGTTTLPEIIEDLTKRARDLGVDLEAVQSADPEVLIQAIRSSSADGIVINPASLSHHDQSLAAALGAFEGPVIEVHISNIHRREPYRRRSLVAPIADGSIVGLGPKGYGFALHAVVDIIQERTN